MPFFTSLYQGIPVATCCVSFFCSPKKTAVISAIGAFHGLIGSTLMTALGTPVSVAVGAAVGAASGGCFIAPLAIVFGLSGFFPGSEKSTAGAFARLILDVAVAFLASFAIAALFSLGPVVPCAVATGAALTGLVAIGVKEVIDDIRTCRTPAASA